MPLHHYLPATYLANFSLDEITVPRRDRVIYVGDKKSKNIFPVTAGDAGAINNLYTLVSPRGKSEEIEQIWARYETDLHIEIPKLVHKIVDPKKWIRLLVPFVACMLVRGPDFNERFKKRISLLLNISQNDELFSSTYINEARMFELQRIIGPVSVANWIVVESRGKEALITNDLGYSPFAHFALRHFGMAVPLNKKFVLAISPRYKGSVLNFNYGMWRPIITYTDSPPGNEIDLNNALVQNAQRYIFCSSPEQAEKYLLNASYNPKPIEPIELGFLGEPHATAHEFTWHRLASTLENNPRRKDIDDFPIDLNAITKGWHSYLFLPMNQIQFPSPLSRIDDFINCNFYNPENYLTLSRVIELEKLEQHETMLNEANTGFQNAKDADLKEEFLFAISNALYNLGYIKESNFILNELIENNPLNTKARINRVSSYIEKRDLENAHKEINEILAIEPDNMLAYLNLGKYYILSEDSSLAIHAINKVLGKLPKGTILGQAYFLRGISYQIQNKHINAIIDFSEAIQIFFKKDLLFFAFYQRAFSIYQLFDNSTEELTKNKKIEKMNSFFGIINRNNYIEKALSDLSNCIKYKVQNDKLIDVYKLQAKLFFRENNFIKAYNSYKLAATLDKDDPEIIFEQSWILILFAKFKLANRYLSKAIKLQPNHGEIYNNRGITYFFIRDFTQAKNDFQKAILLFGEKPESGSPLRFLAQIYMIENKSVLVSRYMDMAKKVEPNSESNVLLSGIYHLYKERYAIADKIFKILSSKVNINYSVFRILSMALRSKFDDAKNLLMLLESKKIPNYFYALLDLHKNYLLPKNNHIVDFFNEINIQSHLHNQPNNKN